MLIVPVGGRTMDDGPGPSECPIYPRDLEDRSREFLANARGWIAAEVSAPYLSGLASRSPGEFFGIEPQFSRRLGEAGLLAITTARQYGGAGRTHLEQALLQSELAWHRAPILGHFIAEREVIPALTQFGTESQREQWLPDLLAGRALCSQAFTEPGSGSDLASVATTAQRAGAGWVLDGVKWLNSVAHVAQHLWVIARTGESRHRDLSMFLVPVDSPGVTIEPLVEMTGIHRLNRITFDAVEVPGHCLIGEEHAGWSIAMETVNRERPGAARPAGVRRLLGELREVLRSRGASPEGGTGHELRLMELEERLVACELLWIDYARDLDLGLADPDLSGVTLKVFADRVERDLADFGASALGFLGTLDAAADAPLGGRVGRAVLAGPGLSLGGGSEEVLLTALATRGLGLPRDAGARVA